MAAFKIRVNAPHQATSTHPPSKTMAQNDNLEWTVRVSDIFSDAENDALTLSFSGEPSFLSINTALPGRIVFTAITE